MPPRVDDCASPVRTCDSNDDDGNKRDVTLSLAFGFVASSHKLFDFFLSFIIIMVISILFYKLITTLTGKILIIFTFTFDAMFLLLLLVMILLIAFQYDLEGVWLAE